MRMINQALAALLITLGLKKAGQYDEALQTFDRAIESLLGLDAHLVKQLNDSFLLEKHIFLGKIEIGRLLVLADIYREEAEMHCLQRQPEKSQFAEQSSLRLYLEAVLASKVDPGLDQVTSKLPALQFYQLAIPGPKPKAGVDFDPVAAARGDELFGGKAECNSCHREPLWTEPGWNLHPAADIGIDSFQADRAPDNVYKTMNLAGVFIRENAVNMDPANIGHFYHDGRFATLEDVVRHYNTHFNLGLTDQEILDLIEYLKSL